MPTPFAGAGLEGFGARRRRAIAVALSLCMHLAFLAALLLGRSAPPAAPASPAALSVELVGAGAVSTPTPGPVSPSSVSAAVQAAPPPPDAATPAGLEASSPAPASVVSAATGTALGEVRLSAASLAGSSGAGSGGGAAGDCDMAARVQAALRRDALVQAALARLAGGATLVWNGDWVRSPGEDGAGLAAVREAIVWEIAFAPPACRAQPVRGVVLLAASPGAARLAVGADQWRWSDLLRS